MESNVTFKSNLYPVRKYFTDDHEFLSEIHDIFALEILKKNKVSNFKMSSLQEEEYRSAAGHCIYAKNNDYPWGTIINDSGKKIVKCKCINTACTHFQNCRKDFQVEELNVLEENKKTKQRITFINDVINEKYDYDELEDNNEQEITVSTTEIIKKENLENTKIEEKDVITKVNEVESTESSTKSDLIQPILDFKKFSLSTQNEIVKADVSDRIIVNAGPGTGKTHTLIEKIIYMIDEQQIDDEEILVFCFSRSAVEVIRSRITNANPYKYKNVDIRTFDSFATYMLAFVANEFPDILPYNYTLTDNSYDERILQAISILKKKNNILDAYSNGHIIIDEVQDLVGARAEFVIELLKILPKTCGFTLLGDYCQSLYDYLADNDDSIMTSEKFYANIFKYFPKAKYYSLDKNHRQEKGLSELTIFYREKILNGTENERLEELKNINKNISQLDIKIKDFSQEKANEYLEKGTLGILTRTNGQALQISSWLRNQEIHHKLQHNTRCSNFANWIAKIFYECKNLTINEDEFLELHSQIYPYLNKDIAQERWNAIVNTLSEIKKRYEIEYILKSIMNNAKDNILFEETSKEKSIIVSNIHRAKGKEFDSVILIDDIINGASDENSSLEHKVCYTALTRAKKNIESTNIGTHYIYIISNENRRCYKAAQNFRTKKWNLSQFEIGIDGDINIYSFSDSEKIQNFIINDLKSGMPLKLIKCPENTKDYIYYEIIMEEPQYISLGFTSKNFASELEQAIKRIKKLSNGSTVFYTLYPAEFDNVFVDEIISYISNSNENASASKRFGDIKIWNGFSISGFAKAIYNKY